MNNAITPTSHQQLKIQAQTAVPVLIKQSVTKVTRKTTCSQHVDTSSGDSLMLNMTVTADAYTL